MNTLRRKRPARRASHFDLTEANMKWRLRNLEEELHSTDATIKALFQLSEKREKLRREISDIRAWLVANQQKGK